MKKLFDYFSYAYKFVLSIFYRSVVVKRCMLLESIIYKNSVFHLFLETKGCRYLIINGTKYLPLNLIALQSLTESQLEIQFVGAYEKVIKYVSLPLIPCKLKVPLSNSSIGAPFVAKNLNTIALFNHLELNKKGVKLESKTILLNTFYKSSIILNVNKTLKLKRDLDQELEHKLENQYNETN